MSNIEIDKNKSEIFPVRTSQGKSLCVPVVDPSLWEKIAYANKIAYLLNCKAQDFGLRAGEKITLESHYCGPFSPCDLS